MARVLHAPIGRGESARRDADKLRLLSARSNGAAGVTDDVADSKTCRRADNERRHGQLALNLASRAVEVAAQILLVESVQRVQFGNEVLPLDFSIALHIDRAGAENIRDGRRLAGVFDSSSQINGVVCLADRKVERCHLTGDNSDEGRSGFANWRHKKICGCGFGVMLSAIGDGSRLAGQVSLNRSGQAGLEHFDGGDCHQTNGSDDEIRLEFTHRMKARAGGCFEALQSFGQIHRLHTGEHFAFQTTRFRRAQLNQKHRFHISESERKAKRDTAPGNSPRGITLKKFFRDTPRRKSG